MRYHSALSATRRILICLAFALAVGACGGGGGGGGDDDGVDLRPLLSGTYCVFAFSGTDDLVDEANATWGTFTADGAGVITGGSLFENQNTVVSGPTAPPPMTYTVDGARALTLFQGGLPVFLGGINDDGSVACVAAIGSGESPSILILGRKEGTYSDASLDGLYQFGALDYDPGVESDRSYWSAFMFDGMGQGATSFNFNTDGLLSSPSPSVHPYSVATDGALTLSVAGISLQGAILAGGDLIVLAGGTVGGERPIIAILIKGATGATDGLLDGPYHGLSLRAPVTSSPEWESGTYLAVADGAGTMSLGPAQLNQDGVVTPVPSLGSPDYAVAADGSLDISGGEFLGGVSPSGDFAMFAGRNASGGDPSIFFLLR